MPEYKDLEGEFVHPHLPPLGFPESPDKTESPTPKTRKKGKPSPAKETMDAIKEMGQLNVVSQPKTGIQCLTIIGQIEGHLILPPQNKTTKYEHIIPQLVAMEQNPEVEGILIILNTVGGDVEAGLALAEMLVSMTKPTVSLVLGGGHSIGAPIAVSSNYSFIAETATMTLHPIRLNGLVIGVPQTYEYLDKMQDRVSRFITRHSKMNIETLREMMFKTGELARDIGTVLIGHDAVKSGLIDEVGGLAQSLAKLEELIKSKREAGKGPVQ